MKKKFTLALAAVCLVALALAGCSRKKRKGGLSVRTIPLSRPPRRGYPEMISPGGAFQTGPGPAPVL